jgi:hypothetical protein
MFGWELVSTVMVSHLCYPEEFKGLGRTGWLIMDKNRQVLWASNRLEQLRALAEGEVLARFF